MTMTYIFKIKHLKQYLKTVKASVSMHSVTLLEASLQMYSMTLTYNFMVNISNCNIREIVSVSVKTCGITFIKVGIRHVVVSL